MLIGMGCITEKIRETQMHKCGHSSIQLGTSHDSKQEIKSYLVLPGSFLKL